MRTFDEIWKDRSVVNDRLEELEDLIDSLSKELATLNETQSSLADELRAVTDADCDCQFYGFHCDHN